MRDQQSYEYVNLFRNLTRCTALSVNATNQDAKLIINLVLKMSAIEYNNLLFKTSQRLNELNVGRQLLVMCRGKVETLDEETLMEDMSSSCLLNWRKMGFLVVIN